MKPIIYYILLIQLAAQFTIAVRMGVSKDITTTSPPNPTTTPATTPDITTILTTEEETLATTLTAKSYNTAKTTFRPFAIPTLPPKLTKPTTTAVPAMTGVPDTNSSATAPVSGQKASWNGNNFCFCNFHSDVCDINCCCDPDCSQEVLQVFNCFVEPMHPELRSRLEDFQYLHGIPSCQIDNGWLCVLRTNAPSTRKNEMWNFDVDTTSFNKWPNPMIASLEELPPTDRDFYKYEEPLNVFNTATQTAHYFELPFAFKPPYCSIKDPIRYLKPLRRMCLMGSLEEMQTNKRRLLELAETMKLLSRPKHEGGAGLIEIQTRSCRASKCWDLKTENTTVDLELESSYATDIIVRILHNYTYIVDAVVEFHEKELGNVEEQNSELWQAFEVRFTIAKPRKMTTKKALESTGNWLVDPQEEEVAISGPLGYLQGEPVIVANLTATDSTRAIGVDNQVFSYFHVNSTKSRRAHSIPTFRKHNGLCSRPSDKEHYINYGINTLRHCKVRLQNERVPQRNDLVQFNFTAVCAELQQLAMLHLVNTNGSVDELPDSYVSQLGKPQNRTDRWLPLKLRNYKFAPVSGEYNERTSTFTCRNIILNVGYEFQVGAFVEQGVTRQALIKSASLELGPHIDLEFSLDEAFEVPLSLTVMFYDHANMNSVGTSMLYFHNKYYAGLLIILLTLALVF